MERRKYKRFKSRLLVTTVYRNELDRIVARDSIFSADVSAGGLRIVFPRRLPEGNILELKVFLFADPIHLPAQGRVAWSCKQQGLELPFSEDAAEARNGLFWVGLQFINIDFFTQERISRWLKKEFNLQKV